MISSFLGPLGTTWKEIVQNGDWAGEEAAAAREEAEAEGEAAEARRDLGARGNLAATYRRAYKLRHPRRQQWKEIVLQLGRWRPRRSK